MTQDALAQRLEVSTKYLQRLEHGTENLTLRTLARMASEFRISPLLLLLPPLTERKPRVGRPSARAQETTPAVRRVAPRPGDSAVIPLYTMRVSAGEEGRADLAEVGEWVTVDGHQVGPDSFLVRVEGDSMAPLIPDGSLALFRVPVESPDGKVLLVEVSENGAVPHYLVKRVQIDWREHRANGGMWATLVSINEAYAPKRVELSGDSGVRLVAEFRAVVSTTE